MPTPWQLTRFWLHTENCSTCFRQRLTESAKTDCMKHRMLHRFFRLFLLIATVLFSGCATAPKPEKLETANVLPLELNPKFQIRKIKRFFNEPSTYIPTSSTAASFERSYYDWGAVDSSEYEQKRGNYLDIYWKARQRADITVRLEYRQIGLGNTVSAQEITYPNAKGSHRSQFRITGDEYLEFGRVSSWRILLIENGKIVAFRQSFLWK